ncbi:MAG: hypothetical protein NVSMB39_3090 [Candidatus Saccharimonadales bacterium]
MIWAVYLLRHQAGSKVRFLVYTLAAAVLAYGLAKIGSHFISDPRPFVTDGLAPLIPHAADNGFPSDHTLITSMLAFAVFFKNRLWGSVMLLVALAVGVSRVAAHVHHPLDIAGSFVISAIAVAIVWQAERLLNKSQLAE